MMQQLLGENLYFVSHTKQGKIMMTVDFEHQNLRIAGSQVTFLYWKTQIKVVSLMGTSLSVVHAACNLNVTEVV